VSARAGSEQRRRIDPALPKAAEVIAGRIRSMILSGALPPGSTLPSEAELLESLGVARGTLREALRLLEAQSLLSVRQGSRQGAVVKHPSPAVAAEQAGVLLQLRNARLKDIYALRVALEPVAARLAAEQMTPERLSELEALHERSESRAESFQSVMLTAEFHSELVRASDNAAMAVVSEMLQEVIARQYRRAYNESIQRGGAEVRGGRSAHAHMLALLRAGDGDQAEQFWREHLIATAAYLAPEESEKVIDLFRDDSAWEYLNEWRLRRTDR
jgi:GntR family transcriptional repressor for pyruvate dehydrogenase complex